ncbi:MAG: hypothetical protein NE330_07705, partial [Lentisphaeraceae bacterium]|nr:hypothetical protein [Lentisphaeraceae bacterium]
EKSDESHALEVGELEKILEFLHGAGSHKVKTGQVILDYNSGDSHDGHDHSGHDHKDHKH